jgi:inorganic pyrophosphatase
MTSESPFSIPIDIDELLKTEAARHTALQDNDFFRVPPWSDTPGVAHAIVEIPKGHRNKYEVDKKTGLIRLDRYLSSSTHYPLDYGCIPQTLAGDGDPLDAIIMVREPTFPGCLIEAKVIGLFQMIEKNEQDVKVLAVPLRDPFFKGANDLDDVPEAFLREVEHFFMTYKQLEGGKVESFGWAKRADGIAVIEDSIRIFFEARRRLLGSQRTP